MTVPVVGEPFDLGPGTLKIGATGSLVDVSCLVNNARIVADKEEGDSTTKLCGTVRPGSISYSFHISGNVDTDVADNDGLFHMSQEQAGTEQDFEYTPSTAAATKATGKLIIDPLDFGGDEMGATMTSDFDFTIVGEPVYTYGGVMAAEEPEAEAVA